MKKDVTLCRNTQLRSHKSMNYLINPVKNPLIWTGSRELQNSKGHGFATRPLPDLHAAFAAATGGDRKQRIDEASYLYIHIYIYIDTEDTFFVVYM